MSSLLVDRVIDLSNNEVLDVVTIENGANSSSFRVYVKKDMLKEYNSSELKDGQFTLTLNHKINLNKIILDKLSIWGGIDHEDETQVSWEFSIEMKEAVSHLVNKLFKK